MRYFSLVRGAGSGERSDDGEAIAPARDTPLNERLVYRYRTCVEPWVRAHPSYQDICNKPELCIPMRIHGDDAPLGRSRGMMILQFCSVMCAKVQTWLSRFLMVAVILQHVVPGVTMEPLYDAIAWSFKVLASGFMPDCDHLGNEFLATNLASAARRRVAKLPIC